ncbi:MAG: CHAT domain-containing protein [Pseudomonadota bacterium]
MRYEDFNIRIMNKRDDGYDVAVESPAGNANAHIKIREDLREAANQLNNLSGAFRGDAAEATRKAQFDQPPSASPEDIGSELFRSLFTGNVRRMYDRSYSSLKDPNTGLRIKLHLNLEDPDVSKLAQVPWEYVYEKDTMEYLALSRQTPLVRYIEVQRPTAKQRLDGQLRILVVMSNPKGVHPLDLEAESKLIEESWARDPSVNVDFLTDATPDNLRSMLVANEYHVLHYMGHGTHDPVTGAGALVLEDEQREAVLMDASTLGALLRDAPSIQLAFLNACDTGKASTDEPFAGVANRLVMAGLPAVVAMQFPISDQAAIDFAKAFYPRLVDGFGIDEATAQGRKAILSGRQGSLEWGTPVLYMRAPDGQLFKTQQPVAPDAPSVATPPPAPVDGGSTAKGAAGGALAVLGVVLLAGLAWAFWPSGTEFKFESPSSNVFVGERAPVRFAPDKAEVSLADLADYGVDIRTASGVDGVILSETAIVNNAWQVEATGVTPGSYTLVASVEALDRKQPIQFTTDVTVALDPAVEQSLTEATGRVSQPQFDTETVRDELDDLPTDKLGANAKADVEAIIAELTAVIEARQSALAMSQADNTLGDRIGAFNLWKQAFRNARGFEPSEAQDRVSADALAAADVLASRTTADKFVLCGSTELCAGITSAGTVTSVHTHVSYTKQGDANERFKVVFVQNGEAFKTRNFPSAATVGGQYIRDYSTVRAQAGEVEARLFNGTGDWIATATYTARVTR